MKKSLIGSAFVTVLLLFIGSCSNDPCKGVTCQNGGTCQSGSCNCPAGYSGSSCQTINTPTSMAVTQITVTGFPSLNPSGNDWNSGGTGQSNASGYANIYPVIIDGSGSVLYSGSQNTVTNATFQSSYTFTPSAPIALSNPAASYSLVLYNSQAGCATCVGSDPTMGTTVWTPFTAGQSIGFPTAITATGGGVSWQLTVTYTH